MLGDVWIAGGGPVAGLAEDALVPFGRIQVPAGKPGSQSEGGRG